MKNGTLTLAGALFQEAYICASTGATPRDYNSRPRGPDFQPELTPVHSPLLRGSCLVSCPPLTYMLKFSGFPDLTSCHEMDWDGGGGGQETRQRHVRQEIEAATHRAHQVSCQQVCAILN